MRKQPCARTHPRLMGVVNDHVWERHFNRVMAPLYGS